MESKYGTCPECGAPCEVVTKMDFDGNIPTVQYDEFNYHQHCQPGPVWVKASERLPGWKKRVKWRDGNNHSYATDGEISLFEMEKPNLEGWEWLDESAATFNPELFQIIRDAEVSKEEDLKAVKEVIGGAAAGRGDAVAFAEWALREGWATSHDRKGWMKHSDDTPYVLTTTELNELFKQQKEK